jgi:hypothetical protein
MQKQMRKRDNAPLKRKKNNNQKQDPNWILRPAFPGQPTYSCKVQSDPVKLTTTVTTGVIASTIIISSANITNFAARFQGFEEGRIIKAKLKISTFSSTNPGRILVYADADDATTPTLALAQSHKRLEFSAGDNKGVKSIVYDVHDLAKLEWTSVFAGLPACGYFKIYTNNANLGSSIVATDYLDYSIEYTLQFRGFSA